MSERIEHDYTKPPCNTCQRRIRKEVWEIGKPIDKIYCLFECKQNTKDWYLPK